MVAQKTTLTRATDDTQQYGHQNSSRIVRCSTMRGTSLDRFRLILAVTAIFILAIFGCSKTSTTEIHHISAMEANALIKKNTGNATLVVLDVRTPREFNQGHIAGAKLLDYHSSDFIKSLDALDKSKTYLVYCTTGYRSSRTLNLVQNKGFKKIYHLQRGIVEWYGQKLPLARL